VVQGRAKVPHQSQAGAEEGDFRAFKLTLKASINKYQPLVSMGKITERETSLFYLNNWWLKKARFQPVL